ncbi:hypothetical protein [Clostridium perfringens]|nr:hypothetical protein [Clostridium perfringens]EIF6158471.1 hypothetical protein [Clostridium perfringens]MDK0847399.1 hypothetical protein [Clostridium perfringens]
MLLRKAVSFKFYQIDEIINFRNNLNRLKVSYDVKIISKRIVFLPKRAAI